MRVSIPRETLEKIKNDYGVSEEKATRLYLAAFDEAESFFWSSIDERMAEEGHGTDKDAGINIYTPREIKAYLDKFIIGQEEYKKRIAIASAFHFAMVEYMTDKKAKGLRRFRKKNTLIAGPSGSGKTYCIEVLGDLLEIPTLVVDATDYTEAGYVGKSADDMIRELIDMAPGSGKQEQAAFISHHGGIIFVDELDKKAKEGMVGHDISREGFQRAILKMIERKFISIENPMSPSAQIQDLMDRQKGSRKKQEHMISTENILFIMGGSFQRPQENLEQIIKKRLSRKPGSTDDYGNLVVSGFQVEEQETDSREYKSLHKHATEDDYIHFGIIPELVGRTPIRSYVNALSKNDLVRIMNDTEDSLLNQYQLEFEAFGISLQFENDAIEFVAEKAEKNKTGARALIGVWEDILTDFQYELPGTSHKHLQVTRTVCEAPKDYLLQILSRSPFEDFCEMFSGEYGVDLDFTPEAEEYVRKYAKDGHIQVSEALKILLTGGSALNFMGYSGKFEITREVLEDPKYFDNLYVQWHKTHEEEAATNPEKG